MVALTLKNLYLTKPFPESLAEEIPVECFAMQVSQPKRDCQFAFALGILTTLAGAGLMIGGMFFNSSPLALGFMVFGGGSFVIGLLFFACASVKKIQIYLMNKRDLSRDKAGLEAALQEAEEYHEAARIQHKNSFSLHPSYAQKTLALGFERTYLDKLRAQGT